MVELSNIQEIYSLATVTLTMFHYSSTLHTADNAYRAVGNKQFYTCCGRSKKKMLQLDTMATVQYFRSVVRRASRATQSKATDIHRIDILIDVDTLRLSDEVSKLLVSEPRSCWVCFFVV